MGVGEAGADFPVRRKCPFDFGFAAKARSVDVAHAEIHALALHHDEVFDVAAEYGYRRVEVRTFPDYTSIDLAVLLCSDSFVFRAQAFPVVRRTFGNTEAGIVFQAVVRISFPTQEA